MAKRNPTRASNSREKRLRGFIRLISLLFVALAFCSCGHVRPPDTAYYRPYTAMVSAVKTVLKKNRIQYTVDPSMEGVIDTDVMGRIEVKRLSSCETHITLSPQTSKAHPLQQRFFDELDRVLCGLPVVPPPPPPPPPDDRVFLPPKSMFIKVKGGGTGNIRSSPRIGYNIIRKLPTGTPVSAYKQKGKWYHISFGKNKKGWAHEVILKEGVPKPVTHVRKPRPAPTKEDAPVKDETSWEPITTVTKDTPPENNEPGQGHPPEDIEASTTPVMQIWENAQVDVFDKPNVTAQITGTLPPGARVTHFKDVGNFYQIEYEGLKGFVYKDFCKILK